MVHVVKKVIVTDVAELKLCSYSASVQFWEYNPEDLGNLQEVSFVLEEEWRKRL